MWVMGCWLGVGAAHGWRLLVFVVGIKQLLLFTRVAGHEGGHLCEDVPEREGKASGEARYARWNRMDGPRLRISTSPCATIHFEASLRHAEPTMVRGSSFLCVLNASGPAP